MTTGPDPRPPLDPTVLDAAFPSGTPWLEVVAATPSTNADVADRARAGEREGLVLATEHQTAGRGRQDRVGETPDRAALTFTVRLRPEGDALRWPWLPLLTGVSAAGALADLGVPVDLKWPNDLLLDGLKVAGILVERVETPTGPVAVLGLGLNVSQTRAELPVDTAGSLALAGHGVDRSVLLLAIVERLWAGYQAWRAEGDDALRADYATRCVTAAGQPVRVDLPDGSVLTGTGVGIGAGGALVVETASGLVEVGAGDVVHVR